MTFTDKFNAIKNKNSILCIGLDPDPSLLPRCLNSEKDPILKFCQEIVDATFDLTCGYKLNSAFFEGCRALNTMEKVRGYIDENLITIADAKRGDIGNTARMYAKAFFDNMGFDAITLNPYMGYDAIEPFAVYKDKASFILCLTSNPSSGDFEELSIVRKKNVGTDLSLVGTDLSLVGTDLSVVGTDLSVQALWEEVTRRVNEWNTNNNLGLVVGATKPLAIKKIREITEMPLLVPGIGKQGGDIRDIVGYSGVIIPTISRSIIYASRDKGFADAARKKTEEFIRLFAAHSTNCRRGFPTPIINREVGYER